MLELRNIVKDYKTGGSSVRALAGVSLKFRENEFVSILGPSGCGKTTMLNIIGGLDQYTSGDLIINGISTKEYKDADWDAYRNHSIGFVFQSYNLIPHQTVLANVELALTLSGISKKERRARAAKALADVGLGDQLSKKPNQLSGGQMQRVAIARALVNDPDILLADEPTGALDTHTSVQIMEILREISHKKLIIMVTHNPELAEQYSGRIISVLDGHVVGDTNPYHGEEEKASAEEAPAEVAPAPVEKKPAKKKKKSMSFFTALSLSLNNLMTKKGRTFMTSFAGSIGIIGIALILSVSTGVNNYINAVQRDTLSGYPIELHAETMDIGTVMTTLMEEQEKTTNHGLDKVYANTILAQFINAMGPQGSSKNDLASFKKHLEESGKFDQYLTAIQYAYSFNWSILVKAKDDTVVKSELFGWMDPNAAGSMGGMESMGSMGSMMGGSMDVWTEMLKPLDKNSDSLINDVLKEQYELVDEGSRWPTAANEVVLVVSENNEISDLSLYALGLRTQKESQDMFNAMLGGQEIPADRLEWTFDEIRQMEFRLLLASDTFRENADGTWSDVSKTPEGRVELYDDPDAIKIKVVGIVRPKEGSSATTLSAGSIGYTSALADEVLARTLSSELIAAQKANPGVDILTGKLFSTGTVTPEKKREIVMNYLATLPEEDARNFIITALTTEEALTEATALLSQMSDDQLKPMVEQMLSLAPSMGVEIPSGITPEIVLASPEMKAYFLTAAATMSVQQTLTQELFGTGATAVQVAATLTDDQFDVLYMQDGVPREFSDSTYQNNLLLLGDVNEADPKSIYLFPNSFDSKDAIATLIREYNDSVKKDKKIEYTDYVGLLMSSITTVLNAITYVLIAFVAISLVVSSIMIGIITYISVLERTKEIGILRSIGASKRDVSRVFNAETLIVGFVAGAIGILVTLFFNIIINIILFSLTGLVNLKATLPVVGAVVLVAISMILTFIAGLFPSRFAAKRNPVEALRSE